MKYYVNDRQMKMIDQTTINETGIPSLILMEQAATLVADYVEQCLGNNDINDHNKTYSNSGQCFRDTVSIAAGTGNNGADGLAVARILYSKGFKTEVFCIGNPERATEEWKLQRKILDQLGIMVHFLKEDELTKETFELYFSHSLFIIDGIFGIGLTREISGQYKTLIHVLNSISVPKIAIDIPSGIYAGTGQIAGIALQCKATVTFGREKTGQHLYPGKNYCGDVVSAPLGFSPYSYEKAGYEAWQLSYDELYGKLPVRPADGHKATFGKVLVIAGSSTMAGAAVFSAKAAYRCGAGLVKIYSVRENRDVLLGALPEAILSLYDPDHIDESEFIRNLMWADSVVFGPGMGQEEYVFRLLSILLENFRKTLIIDADGIRVLAAHRELFSYVGNHVILTPHIGEMSALTEKSGHELLDDPVNIAGQFAKLFHCTIVMKSAVTVIAFPDMLPALEDRGSNALGTAGSGDILTGIIAAFAAGGCSGRDACVCGCAVHALAGKLTEKETGSRSAVASDIINALPGVFCHIDKQFT